MASEGKTFRLDLDIGPGPETEQVAQTQRRPVWRQNRAEDEVVFAQAQPAEDEEKRLESAPDAGAEEELVVGGCLRKGLKGRARVGHVAALQKVVRRIGPSQLRRNGGVDTE